MLRVAVIGSRSIGAFDLGKYLPVKTTEIVSGGARGVDALAEQYARKHNIPLREFRPDYRQYGKQAPFVRNRQIVEACDLVLAFWDGVSHGTMYTVHYAKKLGKTVKLYRLAAK